MKLIFELPTPPSVNSLYRNVKGRGRVRTAKYNAWKTAAGWTIKHIRGGWDSAQIEIGKILKRERPYEAFIYLPEKTRGDVDGRIKALLDLFVEHGVTPDDRFCRGVACYRADTQRAGFTTVLLFPSPAQAEAA